ncbi:MAG: N-acetyltransferase [Betaproteobacteria bacterium]
MTDGISALPRHDDTITVDAHDAQQVMATLTVRFDSLEAGLLAETLYAKEIDQFRATGRKTCEMTKLAVDPRYGSKELLASLIQVAYLYAHAVRGASDLLIEVNPRHAGFYKRMLGFKELGDRRMCPRVNAPAVLLHVELDYMRQQIARHAGHGRHSSEKTLYSYFLNCSAEEWIDRAVRGRAHTTH